MSTNYRNNNSNSNGRDRRYSNQDRRGDDYDYRMDNQYNDRLPVQGRGQPRQQQRGQQQQRPNNQNQRSFGNRSNYQGPRPPVARANFVDDAPPVPGHLSKAHSPMQNDPLMKASIVGEPDIGLSPRADDPNIYTGCDGLTLIIDTLYQKAVSAKQGFSKRVPNSVFATYCATLTYARLLSIHGQNGYRLSPDELEFVRLLKQSEYVVPSFLALYMNGFGNTKIPDGRQLKFKLDKPNYESGVFNDATIPGYFQKVDANTHYRYKAYPCLAVYYQRVLADLLLTAERDNDLIDDGDWDLPDNISPDDENSNYPTENLLGYRRAQILSQVETSWINNTARFRIDELGFEDLRIPFSPRLMNAVCTELQQVEAFKFETLNIQVPQGSLGQLISESVVNPDNLIIENQQLFESTSMCEMNQIVVSLAGPLRYRVLHGIGKQVQGWSIYTFDALANVPEAWQNTINTLRDAEYPELDSVRYQTQTFDPALKVRLYVDNECNQKRLFY